MIKQPINALETTPKLLMAFSRSGGLREAANFAEILGQMVKRPDPTEYDRGYHAAIATLADSYRKMADAVDRGEL